MKWKELKEFLIKEGAIHALDALYLAIRIIDRLQKSETTDIRMFKAKTKNYHVRLLIDHSFDSPCFLVRKKGFMREWSLIEKKDVPACFVDDVFETSCSSDKRNRLVNRMLELKAFW